MAKQTVNIFLSAETREIGLESDELATNFTDTILVFSINLTSCKCRPVTSHCLVCMFSVHGLTPRHRLISWASLLLPRTPKCMSFQMDASASKGSLGRSLNSAKKAVLCD